MKKYILIGSATGIGGWQLYNEARVTYLSQNTEFQLYVICSIENNKLIKLDGFKHASLVNISEVFRPTYVYPQKVIRGILNSVLQQINYLPGDEVFVEATSIVTSLWGELIAEKTNGTCFAYILQSHIGRLSNKVKEYLKYKYDQHLLAGMSKKTVPDIFSGYCDVSNDTRELLASWKPPICDDGNVSEAIEKEIKDLNAIVIGYFGNLTKPHFVKLCSFIAEYCNRRQNKNFVFISIGSSPNNNEETFQSNIFEKCKNVRSINIESLYPVPKSYFNIMDLCIGSWGSATTAALAGTITIRLVDDVDIIPQGILGITILKKPYVDQPKCEETLEQLLDDIIINRKYENCNIIVEPNFADNNVQQKIIDDTISEFRCSKQSGPYYDILSLSCNTTFERILKCLNSILGVEATELIVKCVKRVLDRLSLNG